MSWKWECVLLHPQIDQYQINQIKSTKRTEIDGCKIKKKKNPRRKLIYGVGSIEISKALE